MPLAVIRFFVCLGLIFIMGCQRTTSTNSKTEPPAKLTKENQLNVIELSVDAEKRLGIKTVAIELRKTTRHRTYGGETMLPTGATVVVSAPVAGKLRSPTGAEIPKSGTIVVAKQPVMSLIPFLSPAEKIALATQNADAGGQIQQAQTQLDANQIAFERAERLLKENVGTVRMVDEAKAQLLMSQKALEAAKSRKKILEESSEDSNAASDQMPFVVETPQAGMIRAMYVMPDEVVTAGALLFEIMNTETLWIKVPIYIGEASSIDLKQSGAVGDLAARPEQNRLKVEPVSAPPTASVLSSTVDFYYQLANSNGTFRPGQRVSIELPLVGEVEQPVVPWSAIVQDIYGGHWIYEQRAERQFVRRRVQVRSVIDSWAVLEQSPPVGTTIVMVGTAELFGTEFWVQK